MRKYPLAAVIPWKLGTVSGMTIAGDEIVSWPDAAGSRPDAATLDQWDAEFDAACNAPAKPNPITAEELFDLLKVKGVVSDADRPRPRP